MKVKVTYTTEYDEVPDLVNRLLDDCRNDLKRASEFKFSLLNLDEAAAEFEKVRIKLELVSLRLADCLNLSHGYVGAHNQEPDISEPGEKESEAPIEESE